ncbi:hypothetical protein Avbf_11093 [Armadillidium vulgare]|nr:hypothetical protein Avbf_11093 [Armadillidium vulgare]
MQVLGQKTYQRYCMGQQLNICSALKDFHDICFDETGKRVQLLDDFHHASFRPKDLSSEKQVFKPKNLCKVLHRVGLSICPAFEKLHDICFDKAGMKTDYFNNLLKNNSMKMILKILYERVEKLSRKKGSDNKSQRNFNELKSSKNIEVIFKQQICRAKQSLLEQLAKRKNELYTPVFLANISWSKECQ